MGVNRFAGLLPISHNGKSRALSERDVRLQIYGEHPTDEVRKLPNGARPRDARGRFVAASSNGRPRR